MKPAHGALHRVHRAMTQDMMVQILGGVTNLRTQIAFEGLLLKMDHQHVRTNVWQIFLKANGARIEIIRAVFDKRRDCGFYGAEPRYKFGNETSFCHRASLDAFDTSPNRYARRAELPANTLLAFHLELYFSSFQSALYKRFAFCRIGRCYSGIPASGFLGVSGVPGELRSRLRPRCQRREAKEYCRVGCRSLIRKGL